MVILFANTKGGIGKSVLTVHLAVWLFERGFRVAVLDTDKQGTSSKWLAEGKFGPTVCVAQTMEEIETAVGELRKDHEIIVIDIPGTDSDASQTSTLLSDLAIVPLKPSGCDLWAIKDGLKWIKFSQKMRKKPEAFIVLNGTRKRSKKVRRYREALSKTSIPVASADIRLLDAIADASDDRTHVFKSQAANADAAAADMDALFSELFDAKLQLIEARRQRTSEQRHEDNDEVGEVANE